MQAKKQLLGMNESSLRMTVLKPLFERMGFKDVFHYHGGAQEKGKDFVMWRPGVLGERVNYAVVAKSERITGQANMLSSSAGTVGFQIQQAFGSSFLDPLTGEQHYANFCWVVCSREISKEATEAIMASLNSARTERNVRFIDSDGLWNLVTKYFPKSAALHNLDCATEIFENLDKDWRVVFSTHGGKRHFSFEPKHPGNNVPPLKLGFKLNFGNDEQGQRKAQELVAFYEKGTPVSLDASHIASFDTPQFAKDLFGQIAGVEIRPNLGHKPVDINIRVESDDGNTVDYNHVELRVERGGAKELLMSNRHQGRPCVFEVRIEFPTKVAHLNYEFNLLKGNVHQLVEAAHLVNALAKPGILSLDVAETGLNFLRSRTETSHTKVPEFSPTFTQLLEDLASIQKAVKKELFLPDREITIIDAQNVSGVSRWLRTGHHSQKSLCVGITQDRIGAEHALSEHEKRGVQDWIIVDDNHCENLLGNDVCLGAVLIYFKKGRLMMDCVEELKVNMKDTKCNEFQV